MTDNIAMTEVDEKRVEEIFDEVPTEITSETTTEETSKTDAATETATITLYTLFQADHAILNHYERTKGKLEHRFPMQLIDGSAVDFVDPELNVVLAAGRLRFGNQLMVNNTNGALSAPVYISDLNFKRDTLTVNLQ